MPPITLSHTQTKCLPKIPWKIIPAKDPNRRGFASLIRFIHSICWFDSLIASLIQFIDSIHWVHSLIRFIESIHWSDSLIRFIDSIYGLDSLLRFIDSVHWFDSLIRFIHLIHWFDSWIWFFAWTSCRLCQPMNQFKKLSQQKTLTEGVWYFLLVLMYV